MFRRFESQIFVTFVDGKQVPSHAGDVEILSVKCLMPSRALEMSNNGEKVFFLLQLYLITRIGEFLSGDNGGKKVLEMADGEFGAMAMKPHPIRALDGRKTVVMGLGGRGDKEWAVIIEVPGDGKKGERNEMELVKREDVAKL